MWGSSSKGCEHNCQCAGLITDNFRINSGNNRTKRKHDESFTNNFKVKMNPHSLDFNRKSPLTSPLVTPSKRRILGEIQNSPLFMPKNSPVMERLKATPDMDCKISPLIDNNSRSPLTSKSECVYNRNTQKISRIFEERSKFKLSNKENMEHTFSETFMKFDIEEDARDCSFTGAMETDTDWSGAKLDFRNTISPKDCPSGSSKLDSFVPENDIELDPDNETLHDLEEEFESDNFDLCTKYEIISTDSPNIISRGRTSSSRKVTSRNFVFGAPLSENEQSTSFNRPNQTATRMLTFEDTTFEFTSPAAKRPSFSVKKSLKFSDTPTKLIGLRHEKSDSSIGSMSSSPASLRNRILTSDSTMSLESGFISELEEPFLDLVDEPSNSPKVANLDDLLSGKIKNTLFSNKENQRPTMNRSLSYNPECSKARVSLFSISESSNFEKRNNKRTETIDDENSAKRRKSNLDIPILEKVRSRPILQRAFSENNASIMSALARSSNEPDLIGDFSQPFALPLTPGNHNDLKSISCETLAALMTGQYEDTVGEFQVVDCRYPYEFAGGHIAGAINLYTPALVKTLMQQPKQSNKRSILIFHCEFSRERGPKLSRYLRSSDRAENSENYPNLNFPEIYLLHDGYRAFYQRHPELCSPAGYVAMLDPKHKESLRRHRSVPNGTIPNGRRTRLLM